MEFDHRGIKVRLQGLNMLDQRPFNCKSLKKLKNSGGASFCKMGAIVATKGVSQDTMPSEIKHKLDQYGAIFREPKEMPPRREVDHHIYLVPN